MFTFASGIMGIAAALALAHSDTRSFFDTFKEFISVLTAGLAGLFFIGVFVRRVKWRAAVAGLVANYAVCFALRYAPLPFARPAIGRLSRDARLNVLSRTCHASSSMVRRAM